MTRTFGRSAFSSLTFTRAEGSDLLLAIQLRREIYGEDLGVVPEDELDSQAAHLIARTPSGDVIASLRILGPEFRPFEIEHTLEFEKFLSADRVPALVGRFCIRRDYRNTSKAFLPLGMLKLTYEFARAQGYTDLVLYTFPHLIAFYRGGFFKTTGVVFHHVEYNCNMHIMHMDLLGLAERYSGVATPVARLLLGPLPPNFIL